MGSGQGCGIVDTLSVGAELAVDNDDQLVQAIRNGGQDTINDAGQQIVRRQLNVAPTITIRPGISRARSRDARLGTGAIWRDDVEAC